MEIAEKKEAEKSIAPQAWDAKRKWSRKMSREAEAECWVKEKIWDFLFTALGNIESTIFYKIVKYKW